LAYRVRAIPGAHGLGRLFAQQLVGVPVNA
jgi:hypothetical protein